jgi:hypothetical protein
MGISITCVILIPSAGYECVAGCIYGLLADTVWWALQVIGSVVTVLAIQYGDVWKESNAKHYLADIAFAGTVVGQLVFGYLYVRQMGPPGGVVCLGCFRGIWERLEVLDKDWGCVC